jgi:hypothetical protein
MTEEKLYVSNHRQVDYGVVYQNVGNYEQKRTCTAFRKYSYPLTFSIFGCVQPEFKMDYIVVFFSPIYTQYPIMTK